MVSSILNPIVYIDDDEDDHFLFRRVISELALPHPLRTFRDGLQALHYLETTPDRPLLILCDLNMPVMGGLELQQRIDTDTALRRRAIPFVFFTTGAAPAQLQQAYQGHLQGFHTKALAFADLKAQVALIVQYWQACSQSNY